MSPSPPPPPNKKKQKKEDAPEVPEPNEEEVAEQGEPLEDEGFIDVDAAVPEQGEPLEDEGLIDVDAAVAACAADTEAHSEGSSSSSSNSSSSNSSSSEAGQEVQARPAEPDVTVAMDVDVERPDPWRLLKDTAKEALAQAQKLGASTTPELQIRTLFAHAEPEAVGLPNNLRISYCTATFGRGWQLRAALPHNLLLTHKYRGNVRFVVVVCDPDHEDGALTLSYMQRELAHSIGTGALVLGTAQMEFWHCSVGKNCSHVMALQTPWGPPGGVTPGGAQAGGVTPAAAQASGMLVDEDYHILVNLDADNILDYHSTHTLAERMPHVPVNGGFRCTGKDSGVIGRIGARAKAFIQVGGYLET
ncbi:MAG: hypothetical protein GY772_22815, partial [bacterium]|nr:hypothetical protein [bacterium]